MRRPADRGGPAGRRLPVAPWQIGAGRHTETPDTRHWLIAPSTDLWVVLRLEADTFDFVTAIRPTPDDEPLADWLTDPSPPAD